MVAQGWAGAGSVRAVPTTFIGLHRSTLHNPYLGINTLLEHAPKGVLAAVTQILLQTN